MSSKSKSKSKSLKARQAKQDRKPQPKDGELADDALDQVAGGGGGGVQVAVGDVTSALQLDLQDAAQQQTAAFQTISNVSKARHDAAQSIIKNLKG